MAKPLTAQSVERLKPDPSRRLEIADGQRAGRGCSLFRERGGAPIARRRPTGEGGKAQYCGGQARAGAPQALSA